jgi:transposase
VIGNVLGTSGRAPLEALVAGETNPERLVELTGGRLKASRSQLIEALRGRVRDHHRLLLKLHLGQIDALTAAVRDVEARVGETLKPFHERAHLLTTMPGISETAAHVIVSEIGIDMSRFPTAGHPISWAGCALEATRVPGSAARPRSVRAHLDSRRRSSRRPGRQQRGRRIPTSALNFSASRVGEVR